MQNNRWKRSAGILLLTIGIWIYGYAVTEAGEPAPEEPVTELSQEETETDAEEWVPEEAVTEEDTAEYAVESEEWILDTPESETEEPVLQSGMDTTCKVWHRFLPESSGIYQITEVDTFLVYQDTEDGELTEYITDGRFYAEEQEEIYLGFFEETAGEMAPVLCEIQEVQVELVKSEFAADIDASVTDNAAVTIVYQDGSSESGTATEGSYIKNERCIIDFYAALEDTIEESWESVEKALEEGNYELYANFAWDEELEHLCDTGTSFSMKALSDLDMTELKEGTVMQITGSGSEAYRSWYRMKMEEACRYQITPSEDVILYEDGDAEPLSVDEGRFRAIQETDYYLGFSGDGAKREVQIIPDPVGLTSMEVIPAGETEVWNGRKQYVNATVRTVYEDGSRDVFQTRDAMTDKEGYHYQYELLDAQNCQVWEPVCGNYTVRISCREYPAICAEYPLQITQQNALVLEPGKEYTVDLEDGSSGICFCYTPGMDVELTFSSADAVGDPIVRLYDEAYRYSLTADDREEEDQYNFTLTERINKGQTCYLVVSEFDHQYLHCTVLAKEKQLGTGISKPAVSSKKEETQQSTERKAESATEQNAQKQTKKRKPAPYLKKAAGTLRIEHVPKKLTIKKGKNYQLRPIQIPVTTCNRLHYYSSNKKVASVSRNGRIKARRVGRTRITVRSGSKKVTVKVTVVKKKGKEKKHG